MMTSFRATARHDLKSEHRVPNGRFKAAEFSAIKTTQGITNCSTFLVRLLSTSRVALSIYCSGIPHRRANAVIRYSINFLPNPLVAHNTFNLRVF
jgi:hypothetical protein